MMAYLTNPIIQTTFLASNDENQKLYCASDLQDYRKDDIPKITSAPHDPATPNSIFTYNSTTNKIKIPKGFGVTGYGVSHVFKDDLEVDVPVENGQKHAVFEIVCDISKNDDAYVAARPNQNLNGTTYDIVNVAGGEVRIPIFTICHLLKTTEFFVTRTIFYENEIVEFKVRKSNNRPSILTADIRFKPLSSGSMEISHFNIAGPLLRMYVRLFASDLSVANAAMQGNIKDQVIPLDNNQAGQDGSIRFCNNNTNDTTEINYTDASRSTMQFDYFGSLVNGSNRFGFTVRTCTRQLAEYTRFQPYIKKSQKGYFSFIQEGNFSGNSQEITIFFKPQINALFFRDEF